MRKKTIVMILVFAIILIFVSVVIYSRVLWNTTEDFYKNKADEEAALIAANVDVELFSSVKAQVADVYDKSTNRVNSEYWGTPEFDAYVAEFEYIKETDGFKTLHDFLSRMEKATTVKCAYLAYVDLASEAAVYVVDADPEEPCPPGCFDQYFDDNAQIFSDLSVGFPAYTSRTEYGWLVTAGATIFDADGEVVGYAVVDISMDEVNSEQTISILRLIGPLLLALILICIIGIVVVDRTLVATIKTLSGAASDYCKKNSRGKYDGFSKLKIKTGDELELLAESMTKMENDLNDRFNDLVAAEVEASRSRHIADEMTEIANKDSLTGVRNKTAFDSEAASLDEAINAGGARFGIAMIDLNGLKKTNDTFGHDRGDEMIKALSAMICETFSPCPVFRLGGDEFVVVAKDDKCASLERSVSDFSERIKASSENESLQPWDRVSAAVGYALFDPERDNKVSAVLRRADEAMYENKREMKK